MAYTQADLDRIDRAIAGAELEIQQDGKRLRFRSTDELRQARTLIVQDLERQAVRKRSRVTLLRHGGKGL